MKRMIVCLMIALSGCATLTNGTSKKINIKSDPVGALAVSDNGKQCTTPCSLRFGAYEDVQIKISKDGYNTKEVYVSRKFLGRTFWNILFWPGFIVDFATGAAWKLEPANIDVVLSNKK